MSASAAQPQEASGSELPFTGLDVTWILLTGLGLVGIGFAVRKLAVGKEA